MSKYIPLPLIVIPFILAACATATVSPTAALPPTTVPPNTPAPTAFAGGRCGDGIYDAAEQADPSLCPQDRPAEPGAGTAAAVSTATPPAAETPSPELTFLPDPGLRAEGASNPAAGIAPDGTAYLYYLDRAANRQVFATAPDGLNFGAASPVKEGEYPYSIHNVLLPDGTWRRYNYDNRSGQMTSMASTDGIHFARDEGVRYTPAPEDRGSMGVYEIFSDPLGGVVMLYLGDLQGANNLRRAYSTDNGWTFTFERGDVLGDAGAGGGSSSYVDPKTLLLPDGRRRLFTMKQGTIYSWISDANHTAWTLEPGARLRPSDFTEFQVHAFFDPVVVRLPDGRYRMYVTAGLAAGTNPDDQALVSATTP